MFFPGADVTETDATLGATLALVLSHAGLPPVVALLFYQHAFYLGAVGLSVLVNSLVYHMCRGQWYCFGLTLGVARTLDHITATHAVMAVALVALFGDSGGGRHAAAARILAPFVILFAELAFPFQTQALVIVVTYLVVVAADHLLRARKGWLPRGDRFHPWLLLSGALVAGAGLVCYAVTSTDPLVYAVLHTLWHVAITASFALVGLGLVDGRTRSRLCRCAPH